jgi:putative SOS response-associated peptidase YedK
MCGRYSLFGPATASRDAKEWMDRYGFDIISEINQRDDQFNIAPTQKAPVLYEGEGGLKFEAMRWGLVPFWAKDLKIGAKTINARAETVATKPAFRAAFKARRCLVPASGYFEWTGVPGQKQPFFIRAPTTELLMFAGLWESWRDPETDARVHTYTVVTGEPGKVSGDVHDRQPVILPVDAWELWLGGTAADAAEILTSTPEATLEYYPVSKAVGTPKNKGPELVEPISL